MSIPELEVPGPASGSPRTRGRVLRHMVPVVVGASAIALLVWSVVAVHVDGPLDWQHAGHSLACAPDPLDEPGDVTMALGVGSRLPFRPQGVRLIGAQGVTLVEADVGVVAQGADGDYVLPPVAAGWPSLAGSTMSPSSLVPAAGARIDGPVQHALVLRLHVDDPKAEAGFQDVGVLYRSGIVRHEVRLEYTQQLIPGGTCQL